MSVTYKPLWKLLIDKDLNKKGLCELASVSVSTISKMSRNEYVSLEVLERICSSLDCSLDDIVEMQKEGKEK